MRIVLAGPGRAGMSLARRFQGSGHEVVAVTARRPVSALRAAAELSAAAVEWEAPFPPSDLLLLAVRDDAIADVAAALAPGAGAVSGVVHLSGSTSVRALDAFGDAIATGSFHPLQTLPGGAAGAARLGGAWVAVTSDDAVFADRLFAVARSLGMHPFELEDEWKVLYHAAATAAANYPAAALIMAERLFAGAGVPFAAARPLAAAVVENAFELGANAALTGPIVRGDLDTVRAQMEAVAGCDPALGEAFGDMARATARIAGRNGLLGDPAP